jgi:hypothetical protein
VTVSPEPEGPAGYSYAAVVARASETRAVLDRLREIGFSGWVAPPADGWVVVVPESAAAAVAAGRRGVVEVGEALARGPAGTALAVRVLHDRQLVLVCWADGEEVARYVSDPSREPGAPAGVLDAALGVEGAEALAEACGRPEAGEDLAALLDEGLDPDEEIESERLSRVLALLDLPVWIVTAWVLPRRMPVGPSVKDLTRLGAGRTGVAGWLAGRAARAVRRRRPAPVLADPPRGSAGPDDLMWL